MLTYIKYFIYFPGTKPTKTSVNELLQQRLEQKEEHDRKRQKRHDERMLIETKLLDTLTQFLNKAE